ncbi:hypothetical protein JCM11641_007929 [Rhodosporidiobolus odoratus]
MSSYQLNENPFDSPDFLAGLEAAGYLQRLDTSEARITARYQHALSKMQFAAHSEEFLTRAGVKKVHRSTVQFFNETPVSDPFVHVMVGSLPPSRQALVTPSACETSGWTPIGSPNEADGTIHFTVSHPGFWPITVVFDRNQSDLAKEDKYASIRAADDHSDSDSDPEAYLSLGAGNSSSARRAAPSRGMSSSAYGAYNDSAAAGGSGYASRSGRSRASAGAGYDSASDDDASADDTYSRGRYGNSGGGGAGGMRSSSRASRRAGGMDAMDDMNDAYNSMSLGRSASRASNARRSSSRASRRY